MPVIASNISCPSCGQELSEQGIARAHFLNTCPACGAAMAINAPGALTRSRGATAAGLAGMVLGLGLGTCLIALTMLGINEATLNSWSSAWQAGLAMGVLSAGTLAAFIFQRIQVSTALASTRKKLIEEGLL